MPTIGQISIQWDNARLGCNRMLLYQTFVKWRAKKKRKIVCLVEFNLVFGQKNKTPTDNGLSSTIEANMAINEDNMMALIDYDPHHKRHLHTHTRTPHYLVIVYLH